MNTLQKIVLTSGQKVHERIFEAQLTIPAWNVSLPCTYSAILADFELIFGGKSPKTTIETITFRQDQLPAGDVPTKGLRFTLDIGNGQPPLNLQFWSGGLIPGSFIYKFMAVDASYSA